MNLHVSFTDRKLRLLSRHWQILFLFWLRSHDVDRGGGEIRLDVRRVILLDHLDAGAAVFGDLVDVGTSHQAQTDVCVPQGCRPFAAGLRDRPLNFPRPESR